MKIWLLRHGATVCNDERRYQGWMDIPLSADGLKALRKADIEPTVVYVSPLRRAKQTAAVLFPAAELVEVPALREMNFGAFEGRNYQEMADDPDYRTWVEGGCVGKTPGGESRAAFSDRIRTAFTALVDAALDAEEHQLVILAHGGTLMAALERYALPRRDYYDWRCPLAGGFVLETDATTWRTAHTLRLIQTVQYIKETV